MSFIRIFLLISFIIIINCSGNKVSNYHGSKLLDAKYKKLQVNVTNKNDIIKIIGPPSSISDFNKNKWFYFERLKTNQSLFKLGTQKFEKNNIIVVELNEQGILKSKKLLDLNDMNDIKYIKTLTTKEFKNDNILYGVFSSLREKINAPMKNK
tara:strand:+ start:1249 stop:1707 length:459 start_codon:yes stop_codon:yes gene_type:complete